MSDKEYFVYGEAQDPTSLRPEYTISSAPLPSSVARGHLPGAGRARPQRASGPQTR
ncbi:hypothetical protein ACFU9X_47420 [Streptomyces atratus]|uniref:hypothetical protein n=1 Tax=Streptomyces atratus TaxID=1893 RepID=UPI003681FD43